MEFIKLYLDYFIFGTLGFMSFVMVWMIIERYIFYARIKLENYTHPDELNIALTNHLTVLSSIGANAPYIGLLGTVFGILVTFFDLGKAGGNIDPAAIMIGLSLALKATAVGLLVAIPAILFYNALLRKVEVLTARWNQIQAP
ncbi:MAG: Ferric siderophore transport system, biopolymer transport protein ExbB [uncultured Thiotrichaceae bacterium]|uniref:Ferric siderophore transport system, biopolymer transport protein ExbB n=1 Tax=uncultured Thiotrichaceae bacterium TaxID=298394 RepID=A0A6S6U8B6_9GAMM|nr:MAG: Ferric siderophore transport system, biopolymer transport protein ExbB [uncultured Thiotrichaceae bacterium]